MNELYLNNIKKKLNCVVYKKHISNCVSELYNTDSYQDIIIVIERYIDKLCRHSIEILLDVIYSFKKDNEHISLFHSLYDRLFHEAHYKLLLESNRNRESNLENNIIQNFNTIFPNFSFIKNQYTISTGRRIDILAKDKDNNRHIIFEIKKGSSNPTKQLLEYAKEFDDPLLIGINETKVKYKNKKILYYLYDDLINMKF